MHTLSLRRVSYSYTSAQTIFQDLSVELYDGWTGLVGANGAGKTTLLRLLSGELTPDSGSIQRTPSDARVLLCAQTIEGYDDSLAAFADAQDKDAYRLRGLLNLTPEMFSRWSTLSPGERKRWQLGAALYESPEILLLDEPSNHLDAEGKQLLSTALQSFAGIGILVSHDRDLLGALTTQTLRCTPREVTLYPGDYLQAQSLWDAEAQRKKSEYNRAKQEEDRLQRQLIEQREALRSAEKNQSSKHRMKNIHDHDARSMGRKIATDWAAARYSRNVSVVKEKTEKASATRADFQWQREVGRSLFVNYEPPPSPWIASLQRETLSAGDTHVLSNVSIALKRGEKVWLKGPNGAGKTTLLYALYCAANLPKDRLLFLPQELSSHERDALLQAVRRLPSKERGQVLSLLAALGVEPGRVLSSQKPSPGEARKLALAYGLGNAAWALFLDEPTNHLDLPSIERLEEALSQFPGALLLISHDASFAARCTLRHWQITEGTLLIA